MAVGLDTVMIDVADMDRTVAFYRDAVGLALEMTSPFWSSFALGSGASLGLHGGRKDAGPRPSAWTLGLHVDDILAARDRIVTGGGRTAGDLHDIPGGVILDLSDPEGNAFEIIQHGVTVESLAGRA